jgi:hypothetical protein
VFGNKVGRALMDASEIRQMTKYKQAVAIISNAPPVRLTFPKLAKADHPPLSERERRFQIGRNPNTSQRESLPESGQTNDYLTPALAPQGKTIDQATVIAESAKNQWAQAMATASARHSENFEPEYDPDTLDEDSLPLFDFGGRDL